jgi:hypothetical protein
MKRKSLFNIFLLITSMVTITKAQNITKQKTENNFSYSQYSQILNPHILSVIKENESRDKLFSFRGRGDDTSQWKLKLRKIKRKYYFVYDNQAPKLIFSHGDYSQDFKNIIKTNPEAQLEFNQSRYYSYAAIVGDVVFTAFVIKEFAHTISESNQLNNNTIPNTGFKFGDFIPLIISGAFTVTVSVESKRHFKEGFWLFNEKL